MFLRFFQKTPSLRLLLSYLLGVIFLSCYQAIALSLFFFGVWGLFFYRYIENKIHSTWSERWIPGICIVFIWMSMGAFFSGFEQRVSSFPGYSGKHFVALVKIETLPIEKHKSWQCNVRIKHTNVNVWNGKKLQVYIAKSEKANNLRVGDVLMVNIKPQKPAYSTNTKVFDYADWLRKKGICATAYLSSGSWKLYSMASIYDVSAKAEQIRSVLLERFRKANISGEDFSLVSAMTLGSVNLLTSKTKYQFSVTGVTHILSVSGLHVGAIYAILEFLLSFFNRFNKLKIAKQILIIIVLWGYAFVTGLSPPVMRSALMFSLLIVGGCLNRKVKTVNTVLFSAFLLLLWKPSYLFDLSFELSYCAVLSIVIAYSRLKSLLNFSSKIIRYLWEMICLSTVAQLGTIPLTIYYFHQFPNYFLLNNLVAVPASALIIYIAVAFLLLFNIPVLGFIVSWLLKESLYSFHAFVDNMSELPFALTQNIEIQRCQVFVLYGLMCAFFIWFFLKHRSWIFAVLFFILLFQLLSLSNDFKFQKSSYLCKKEIHDYKNYCRRFDRSGKTYFESIKCCGYYISSGT